MQPPYDIDIPLLLEGIPYAAMILDTSSGIIAMNRRMEAMTGYPSKKVIGIHGSLVVRSSIGDNEGLLYDQVLKSGEALSITGDIINSNRKKVPIQYTVAPLDDTSGQRCGLLVIAEDISSFAITEHPGKKLGSVELVSCSPKMQKVIDMIPLLAQTEATVMITGETGTGKDKIAEIIHQKSSRFRRPFIKINCGALPMGLLESELFGHVKGAFTGASRNKPGMFKLADKGTLFLTEIGDMPLPLQVKLLSVLDDREFVPVGGEEKVTVDVRIIAATHRQLRDQVRKNKFREDLYYRLNVLHIHLPPLRERVSDTRYLVDYFWGKYAKALDSEIEGISQSAMQILLDYKYPGNIRELSNIVEYAVNVCRKKKICREHLPSYLFEKQINEDEMTFVEPKNEDQDFYENPDLAGKVSSGKKDSQDSWDDIERKLIVDTLKRLGGNRTSASLDLGWGRMKLWRKMKKYNLLH